MDNTLINVFKNANRQSVDVYFEIDNQKESDVTYEVAAQDIYAKRGGNNIYGVAYIPQNINKKLPAVIFSHGYGGSYRTGTEYAQALAEKGYFVYTFDFCGGGGNRSDGSRLDMSVFTEQEDLEAVISMAQGLNYIDKNNIFLMGSSQGCFVSAITAEENKDKIRGEILLYPAFSIPDDVNRIFKSVNEIPDSYYYLWMTVGRAYFENLIGYNIFENIGKFDRDILIIHGDDDDIVPVSYSERALNEYKSAELKIINGAGHGFYNQDFKQTVQWTLEYLKKQVI